MRKSRKTARAGKPRRRKRVARKRTRKSRSARAGLSEYQRLVLNPCSGSLVKSLTGGSTLVERTRTSITLNEGSAESSVNGYMIWFPSYHGAGSQQPFAPTNWYYFVNASSVAPPLNTAADPLGRVAANTTGRWLIDPAFDNLKEDSIFSTGKTVAACLTMDYQGTLSDAKGQFCVVRNLDVSALMNSRRLLEFPTVDQMFDYASVRGRLPIDGQEVIWRPSDEDAKPRLVADPTDTVLVDALFKSGSIGTVASVINDPDPSGARGIVIAWRGVPENSLVFNAVKVAEYTLSLRSKAVEMPVSMPTPGFSIDSAIWGLDKLFPGWQNSALRGAQAAAKEAAARYILPSAMTYMARAGSNMRIMNGEL